MLRGEMQLKRVDADISYTLRALSEENKAINCKPLLKWPGGKTSELSEIEPRMPEHERYFEPFFGGGSVYFSAINKPSYINDSYPELMLFYNLVKTRNVDFFSLLDDFLTLWNSGTEERGAIYIDIRDRYNKAEKLDMQKVVDFFILREYAYGGMFRVNLKGEFNVPFGHNYVNKDIQKKVDYLSSASVLMKLKKSKIYNLDFQDFLGEFDFDKNDFMFVDPPYHCAFSKYNKDDFNVKDQERLADTLFKFKGKFMLVVQYTELIEKLYKSTKLNTHLYDKKYRFNIKGRFNRSVKHALITNYDTSF